MKISFTNETSQVVDEKLIIDTVERIFKTNNLSDKSEASVALVDHSKIVDLAVRYMKESIDEAEEHPVLSFLTSELEHEFVFPPDNSNFVGEIIVSLQKAHEQANEKGISVNQEIIFLIDHGALHLSGVHHD